MFVRMTMWLNSHLHFYKPRHLVDKILAYLMGICISLGRIYPNRIKYMFCLVLNIDKSEHIGLFITPRILS